MHSNLFCLSSQAKVIFIYDVITFDDVFKIWCDHQIKVSFYFFSIKQLLEKTAFFKIDKISAIKQGTKGTKRFLSDELFRPSC